MRKSALFAFGLVVTMLVTLGLVVLSSARIDYMTRQLVYLAIAIVVVAGVASIDYHIWRYRPALTVLFCGAILALLVAVLFMPAIKGSHRWFKIGTSISLQPSEFAKLAIVIVLSAWLDYVGWQVGRFVRGALMPAVFIGIMAVPVLLEPDFGSVMVIGAVGFMLMFMAGTRILHMLPFAGAGLAVFVYRVVTNPNRMARLNSFFGGKLESLFGEKLQLLAGDGGTNAVDIAASNAAYQVKQALIAIANGGLTGVGLNQSMQKHQYLPESYTDFILAIGAEELGIGFSIAVLTLFALFFALAVYIARKAPDRYGRFLVMGMTFVVFFQAMFNVGVVCKALPTKGVALPFFSYGGTNLICSFFAVGTILSVGVQSFKERKRVFLRKVVMR